MDWLHGERANNNTAYKMQNDLMYKAILNKRQNQIWQTTTKISTLERDKSIVYQLSTVVYQEATVNIN